jgi:hypothetical protein
MALPARCGMFFARESWRAIRHQPEVEMERRHIVFTGPRKSDILPDMADGLPSLLDSKSDKRGRSSAADRPEAYLPHHRSTQSFTVLYQSCEFCGLSTQWPSSGKYNILDGTFSRCSVVKS